MTPALEAPVCWALPTVGRKKFPGYFFCEKHYSEQFLFKTLGKTFKCSIIC